MQNYESNRKKILDLLEFARKNLPADLRVSIQSAYGASHIEIGSNDNGTKISRYDIKDGLNLSAGIRLNLKSCKPDSSP